MNITIDFKNYNKEAEVYKRTAARAIISRGDKYLMITSRFGDAKFPGGGKEAGEDLISALIREIKEETGYKIIPDSIEEYGSITEKRVSKRNSGVMQMKSFYYFCEVAAQAGERTLEPYEIDYEYENAWLTLGEALKKNNQITDITECQWVRREIEVMEQLSSR